MPRKAEPALLGGFASAILVLLAYYGFVSREEAGLWEALILAAIPVLQGWWTRQRVVPNKSIEQAGMTPTEINVRAGLEVPEFLSE